MTVALGAIIVRSLPQMFHIQSHSALRAFLAPNRSDWRGLIAAMLLVFIPFLIAQGLIATTNVSLSDYGWVANILIQFSFSGVLSIAIGGLLIATVMHFWKGRRFEPLPVAIGWYLAAGLIAGLTIPAFGIFKQMILPQAGFPWDVRLAAWDRALFFGTDPWRITHSLFSSLQAMQIFDFFYSKVWMVLMYGFPAFVVALVTNVETRFRLILCWIVSWVIVASIMAYLFGSAGPCYYNQFIGPHQGFAEMNARLASLLAEAREQGGTIDALQFQPMLAGSYKSMNFAPAGGISAMPSMHVAMTALFAIAGFKIHRWAGWIMVVFSAIIWVGSIHLGWHYALDGIVGIPAMVLIWVILQRVPMPFISQKAESL